MAYRSETPLAPPETVSPDGRRGFDVLVEPFRPQLYTYLVRMVGDRAEAEDLLQETLFKAWRGLPGYEERLRFSSWLFRIAQNVALDALRRARVRSAVSYSDDLRERGGVADPETEFFARETSGRIDRFLAALPDEQRDVFLLRMHTDMTFQDIADLTETPLSTVLSRMSYAVQKLRAAVGEGP